MRKFMILLLCLWAFLVVLKGGQKVAVPDAVGFGILEKDYAPEITQTVMVFFDREFNTLQVFPLDIVGMAVYVPEGGMM